MNGQARNATASTILSGTPVAEDASGKIFPATAGSPAFAVASNSGGPGQLVDITTDGTVERSDWTMLTGARLLSPGQAYFVSNGRLSTTGAQQVGVARSSTVLRVGISHPAVPVQQIWPTKGQPMVSLGRPGDFAFDASARALYGPKTQAGWGAPSYLSSNPSSGSVGYGDPAVGISPGSVSYDATGKFWVFTDSWNKIIG